MSSVKGKLARKAVKSTAKHSAHGTAARLRRDPVRSAVLLAVGCAVGLLVGWFVNRPGAGAAGERTT